MIQLHKIREEGEYRFRGKRDGVMVFLDLTKWGRLPTKRVLIG